MACKIFCFTNYLSHSFPFASKFPQCFSLAKLNNSLRYSTSNLTPLNSTNTFTWDDVVQVGQSQSDPSDLSGFFHKVSSCNRNVEKLCEFVPFLVEEQIVGYVHNEFSAHLRKFKDVFSFPKDVNGGDYDWHITFHPALKSPESRTAAVADVINCLGDDLIPGIRNELYPVTSCFGTPEFFSLERAAAPYFGIKAYGVHMNGYVEKDGQKFLWLAKRSQTKATYPGMLDHLVAGGLPHGIPCGENMMKECEEEAGIPYFISKRVEPVGAISYMDINGDRLKRDVIFCYDLKLPEDFVPHNNDGEVESFRLIPVPHAASVIKKTQFFKSNCTLVIIDFLFRHGFICPEYVGYLKLLQSLRGGEFS